MIARADDWPFSDPRNVITFSCESIINGEDWIYYVSHDLDDGSWQFHPSKGYIEEIDARLYSLKNIVAIEPRIMELADLPLGWTAWRETRDGPWICQRKGHEVIEVD